jgi:hypothetical protein
VEQQMLVPELSARDGQVRMVSASVRAKLAEEQPARYAGLAPMLVPKARQGPDATSGIAHGFQTDERVSYRLRV